MQYLSVRTSRFRAEMTKLVDLVEKGEAQVVLSRYGRGRVALVSFDDLFRIWEAEADEEMGAKDPDLGGKRPGEVAPEMKAHYAEVAEVAAETRKLGLDGKWNRFWSWLRRFDEGGAERSETYEVEAPKEDLSGRVEL
ncbi:hypothetical protein [Celeribacter arenosi]|uniref:Antitoxin n=1 Tax=Celeribacter arenosi TaxID=792649 RepID=A0ABP7K5A2_9RHOB